MLKNNTLVRENIYKRVKSIFLEANRWLVIKKLIGSKKADRKKKNTKEYINKEFFSISK